MVPLMATYVGSDSDVPNVNSGQINTAQSIYETRRSAHRRTLPAGQSR